MQAILALEDGRIFRGQGYGSPGECQGEVVFNTSLTGYQEIATDPSYAGQIVVLTNPQIGNYGTNQADNESAEPYIEGLDRARILGDQLQLAFGAGDGRVHGALFRSGAGGDRYAGTGAAFAHARRDARRDFDQGDERRCSGAESQKHSQDGWDGPGARCFDEVGVQLRLGRQPKPDGRSAADAGF